MNFDEWWETLPAGRPNRPRKVARESWEAALASRTEADAPSKEIAQCLLDYANDLDVALTRGDTVAEDIMAIRRSSLQDICVALLRLDVNKQQDK